MSRKGRPSIGLQTLINRTQGKPPMRGKLAAPTLDEVEYATGVLEQSKGRKKRYRDQTALGGALSPVVRGIGRAVEAGVSAKKGKRFRSAIFNLKRRGKKEIKGLLGTNKGEAAKHVFEGGAGGAAVSAIQDTVEVGRAKNIAKDFLKHEKEQDSSFHKKVRRKLAADFNDSLAKIMRKTQVARNNRLEPIMDGDTDYEI